MRRPLFWGIVALATAAGLYLALAVFGVQTLFLDTEVNEEFEAESNPASADESSVQQASPATPAPRTDPETEEEPEPRGPVLVSSGGFHDVEYAGTGDALVYRLEDGSHVLRLENLNVENGPDLYVYAVAAPDANDAQTVTDAGFLNLGQLKGNQGDQTYALPDEFDPDEHRAISVWCQRFSANFVTAPLS